MAQTQLYYIGTSKIKEIRGGGEFTRQWGEYSKWRNFKSPVPSSSKKVKYDKNAKNKAGASGYGGVGGVTRLGSHIPSEATRVIFGVEVPHCEVRYYVRGYTKYTRTAKLKKDKKMKKAVYTKAHPYQYRLQYKDKPVVDKHYSSYEDGVDYLYFANVYYKDGVKKTRNGHLPHPVTCEVTYSDVRRNFESNANNSDGRDNKGSYVLTNVRSNVITLNLTWAGLSADDGADLIDTLNPTKTSKGTKRNYLTVQFRNPATNSHSTRTFYASDRKVEKYPSGIFKEISVTLTEV